MNAREPRSPIPEGSVVEQDVPRETLPAKKKPGPKPKKKVDREMKTEPRQEKSDPRESETRDESLSMAEKRATRIPLGRNSRLDAIANPYRKPDIYLRFVLDKPGRLETYLSASYEFVLDASGKHVTFPSGASHLHLMKLPLEFREADLAERESQNEARLGKEIRIGADEYSPEDKAVALTQTGTFQPSN